MFKIGRHMERCDIVYRISSDKGIDGVEVHEMADVMYSMADLVQASLEAAGYEGELDVRVKPFQQGSFIAEFSFAYDQVVSLFSSDGANALANVMAFLGFGGISAATLPKVIRKVRGKINEGRANGDGTFTYGDGEESVTIDARQQEIVSSPKVAKSFSLISVSPIKKIDKSVHITVQKSDDYRAGRATGDYFTDADIPDMDMYRHVAVEGVPEEREEIVSLSQNVALNPIFGPYDGAEKGYTFKYDSEKWTKVQMHDLPFRLKLESGEIRFHERDVLIVDMEIVQVVDKAGKLKVAERRIMSVKKYIPYSPDDQATIDELF